jgi:hypothetical protein
MHPDRKRVRSHWSATMQCGIMASLFPALPRFSGPIRSAWLTATSEGVLRSEGGGIIFLYASGDSRIPGIV